MSIFGRVAKAVATGGFSEVAEAGKNLLSGLNNNYQAQAIKMDGTDATKAKFAQAIKDAQTRTGPQQEFRNDQRQNVGQLQQAAAGQGPSVAEATLRMNQEQNLAQANAMAASARGDMNPAMVQRQAAQNMAANQMQIGQQAAVMKAQEQQQAQQLLNEALAQGRGQDIQQQQQLDDLVKFYEAQGLSIDQANQMAAIKAQEINAGVAAGNSQGNRQLIGGIISGGASAAAAMSDKRVKKNVKDGSKEMYKFLDQLKAHKYEYKEPKKDGEGKQHSVMAQELEKTSVGKSMIQETERGKMVDYGKGFGAILAAQAALHDRLKDLEGKK